jgi:hypothetical protein
VAVATIKPEAADVVLVAKWDGLLWGKSLFGVVANHWNDPDRQNQTNSQGAGPYKDRVREQICAGPKDRRQNDLATQAGRCGFAAPQLVTRL